MNNEKTSSLRDCGRHVYHMFYQNTVPLVLRSLAKLAGGYKESGGGTEV